MTAPLTEAEIREALARAERATPGPWEYSARVHGVIGPTNPNRDDPESWRGICNVTLTRGSHGPEMDNAEFIAHARTDVPRLAADLLAAREERERLVALGAQLLADENEAADRAEAAEAELDALREWKRTHSVDSTLRTRAERAEARCRELEELVQRALGIIVTMRASAFQAWADDARALLGPHPVEVPLSECRNAECPIGCPDSHAINMYDDEPEIVAYGNIGTPPTPSPEPEATPVEEDTMAHEDADPQILGIDVVLDPNCPIDTLTLVGTDKDGKPVNAGRIVGLRTTHPAPVEAKCRAGDYGCGETPCVCSGRPTGGGGA